MAGADAPGAPAGPRRNAAGEQALAERRAREAQALRDNLQRRKAQLRARAADAEAVPDNEPPTAD